MRYEWPNAGIGSEIIKEIQNAAESYEGKKEISTVFGRKIMQTFCEKINDLIEMTGDDGRAVVEAGRLIKNVTSGCYILSRDGFDEFHDDMLETWKEEFGFSPLLDKGVSYPKLYEGEAPLCLSDNAHAAYLFLTDAGVTFGNNGTFSSIVWKTPLLAISKIIKNHGEVVTPLTPGYDSMLRTMQKKAMDSKKFPDEGIVFAGTRKALGEYIGQGDAILSDTYSAPTGTAACLDALRSARRYLLDYELGTLLMCADYGRRLLGYRFVPDIDPDNSAIPLLMYVLLDRGKQPSYLNSKSRLLNPNLASYVRVLRKNDCYNTRQKDILSLRVPAQSCDRLSEWLKKWDEVLVFLTETRVTGPKIVAGWARKGPFDVNNWEQSLLTVNLIQKYSDTL